VPKKIKIKKPISTTNRYPEYKPFLFPNRFTKEDLTLLKRIGIELFA